jgi:hypothetical protein
MKSTGKPPLRWTGVLFALAANMLLVTVFRGLVQVVGMPFELNVLDTMVAPLLAGVLTAFYAPHRGGMHAFLGGMLSIPCWRSLSLTASGSLRFSPAHSARWAAPSRNWRCGESVDRGDL